MHPFLARIGRALVLTAALSVVSASVVAADPGPRPPRPTATIIVDSAAGAEIVGVPSYGAYGPASYVELRSDGDEDGVFETLHDSDTVALDGSFDLTALSGFGGTAVLFDASPEPDVRRRQICIEWKPGHWACWWE